MKSNVFLFQLTAIKMFTPELDKGEKNPYTKGHEIGNPFMDDIKLEIDEADIQDVLVLLKDKGYDTSKFQ